MLWQVLGDRRLREAEAELEQFAMDARSAPGEIRAMHLHDELTNLRFDARSSRAPQSALPAPVEAETLSVPADHGLRAHKEESLTPFRPKPRKPGPEHAIGGPKLNSSSSALAFEDEELVTKRGDLSPECSSRTKKRAEHTENGRESRARHRRHVDPVRRKHQSFVRQESLEEEEDLWKRESETSFRTQRGMPARERLATTR